MTCTAVEPEPETFAQAHPEMQNSVFAAGHYTSVPEKVLFTMADHGRQPYNYDMHHRIWTPAVSQC